MRKVLEASASEALRFIKSAIYAFYDNALQQRLNESISVGFDDLRGFAMQIDRAAVYSADMMIQIKRQRRTDMYESKMQSPETDRLFDTILALKDREACYRFFDDLCTYSEISSMTQRLQVAQMLS